MRVYYDEYKGEVELQDLILENPQIVLNPLDDDEAYIRIKEFGIGGKSIDILLISKRGNTYIIETKLYKNPKYRESIAQVLEYASLLYKESNREIERLMKALGLDPEAGDELTNIIQENLENGNYNLIIAMDHMPEDLKQLLEFVNTKPGFKLYILEIKECLIKDIENKKFLEIELYGKTERQSRPIRVRWTIDDIEKEISKIQDKEVREVYEKILGFIKEKERSYPGEVNVKLGTGKTPTFGIAFNKLGGRMLFKWTIKEGYDMQIYFDMAEKKEEWQLNLLTLIAERLSKLNMTLPQDYLNKEPSFAFKDWSDNIDDILKIIDEIVEKCSSGAH